MVASRHLHGSIRIAVDTNVSDRASNAASDEIVRVATPLGDTNASSGGNKEFITATSRNETIRDIVVVSNSNDADNDSQSKNISDVTYKSTAGPSRGGSVTAIISSQHLLINNKNDNNIDPNNTDVAELLELTNRNRFSLNDNVTSQMVTSDNGT